MTIFFSFTTAEPKVYETLYSKMYVCKNKGKKNVKYRIKLKRS